jgi:hypothetical protein
VHQGEGTSHAHNLRNMASFERMAHRSASSSKGGDCWGLDTAFPCLAAPEDCLHLEPPSCDPSGVIARRFRVELTVTRLVWCWVNAGTKPVAEATRNEGEDLRVSPTSEDGREHV